MIIKARTFQSLIIYLLIVFAIFLRYLSTRPVYKNGDTIRISSKVTSEPVRYSDSQYLSVQGLRFYLSLYPEVSYGDKVVVEGIVEDRKLKSPNLVSISESSDILSKLRQKLIAFYRYALPEPHSSLIAGVTIGSKSAIPEKFWNSLKYTGTAHVVVASGMNVTLVAGFLVATIVLVVARKKAIILALMGIWLYALLSGFDAPIIRAAIMGSIAFSAQALGRVNFAWHGLLLSAIIMLLVNPLWLTDYGFILSFTATTSLMLFQKRVERYLSKVPIMFKEGLSTSLAVQIGVAPILYAAFGQFNVLSPFINGLVLWTIAPITVIGMIAGIISLVSVQLGTIVLYASYPLTYWFVRVIELFSN
jgi:competence protein ComEC